MSEIVGFKVREDLFYVTSTDAIREDHFVHENLSKNYLRTGSCRLDQMAEMTNRDLGNSCSQGQT